MTVTGARCDIDDVVITGALDHRPSRAPDFESEAEALRALATTMATHPETVLQRLVELAMALTRSDSAGVSLLEPGSEQSVFKWVATAGVWAPYRDATMQREDSPCGEVVARNTILLMDRPARAFPALLQADPGIGEALLVPFSIDGVPMGTVWTIMHGGAGHFQAEDARLLTSLSQFAAIAHKMVRSVWRAEAGRLANVARLEALTRASSDVFYTMSADMSELRALAGGNFIADTTSPSRAWLRDYIPPEDQARTAAAVAEAVRTKGVFELEHQVRQVDDGVGWVLSRAVPVLDADGEIVEWFGAASNITSRKLAEAQLIQSEARQAFLLRFGDALRAEPGADAIANRALRMLFDFMKLDRSYIGIYRLSDGIGELPYQVYKDDLAPVPTKVHLSDFPEALQIVAGRTLVIDDLATMADVSALERSGFAGLGVGALINATLRKGENIPLWSLCAVSTAPRVWTAAEISLVEVVAERTWTAIERARADAALTASADKYRTLFDSIDEGVSTAEVIFDAEGRAVDYRMIERNAAADRIAGIELTPGKTTRELVPDIEEEWIQSVARVARTGEPIRHEYPVQGLGIWVSIYIARVGGEGSRTVVSVYTDITARKHADDALRASEARERAVFVASPTAFLVLAPDAPRFTIVDVNEAYLAATMRTREQLIGRPLFEAFPNSPADPGADGVSNLTGSLMRVLETGAIHDLPLIKYDVARPEGGFEQRWWHAVQSPLLDAAGAVEAIIHHATDVTERHRTNTMLRTSEARIRGVLDGMAEGFALLAPDFTIVELNAEALRLETRPRESIIGQTHWDAYPGSRDSEIGRLYQHAMSERVPVGHEHQYEWGDGHQAWLDMRAYPTADGGLAIFYRDVTTRKAAEAALREAEAALRHLNSTLIDKVAAAVADREVALAQVHEMQKLETIGQLTGGIAHDFNNLLTPIVGSLDMVRRKLDGDERSQRLIAGAQQSAERARVLISRLLTFARRQHLEPRSVNVAEIARGMEDLVARSIGPQVMLVVNIAPGLPPARVDPNQLELALLNLCINARDAMPGGGSITVTADTADAGDIDAADYADARALGLAPGRYVRLWVTDTGVGMDPETLRRAVEPFYSTKGVGKGTGLGLSMVHGLAGQSGGTLQLTSTPGGGTTAIIWLPVADTAATARNDEPQRAIARTRPLKLLLVDDEELVRMGTADMLADLGHEVAEAASGFAALEILKRADIDVIVTDYAMPGMTGAELAAAARLLKPDLPILILTGYANLAEDVAHGLPRLAKPFRQAELAACLASLVDDGTMVAMPGLLQPGAADQN